MCSHMQIGKEKKIELRKLYRQRLTRLFNNLIKRKEGVVELFLSKLVEPLPGKLIITYMNQSNFNIFCEDEEYQKIILENTFVYSDGIGMHSALKFLGEETKQNISTDINTYLLEYCIENNFKIAMIGGYGQIYKSSCFQKLNTIVFYKVGSYSDSFLDEVEEGINSSKPLAVFIGMGVPLQELIALEIAKRCDIKVIVCVGNFFEYYFGTMKRAPLFIRKLNIEWVYRLCMEPKRLWKRYIFGVPKFIFRIIYYKCSGEIHETIN